MYALGRILQFSYMSGTKKNREFSGDYVNLDEKYDLSQYAHDVVLTSMRRRFTVMDVV